MSKTIKNLWYYTPKQSAAKAAKAFVSVNTEQITLAWQNSNFKRFNNKNHREAITTKKKNRETNRFLKTKTNITKGEKSKLKFHSNTYSDKCTFVQVGNVIFDIGLHVGDVRTGVRRTLRHNQIFLHRYVFPISKVMGLPGARESSAIMFYCPASSIILTMSTIRSL